MFSERFKWDVVSTFRRVNCNGNSRHVCDGNPLWCITRSQRQETLDVPPFGLLRAKRCQKEVRAPDNSFSSPDGVQIRGNLPSSSNFKISAASRRSCFCRRTSLARIFAASPTHTLCRLSWPSPQTTGSCPWTPSRSAQAPQAAGKTASLLPRHAPTSLLPSPPWSSPSNKPCLSSIILSPLNGNVKMSPHETEDIPVESEGTAKSERDQRVHQGRHGVCQSRRTPVSERAPD